MPPFAAYLVFGIIKNPIGDIVPNASLLVITPFGQRPFTSDSDGKYVFDLATVGYTSGGIVTIDVKDRFNNEFIQDKFTVTGFFRQADITLAIRTIAVDTTGGSTQTILHSIGNKPITRDNPLPTFNTTNPVLVYGLAGGDSRNRIFGYLKVNGEWYIQKFNTASSEYLYIKGSTNFVANWGNRTSLPYKRFNEVFP